MKRPWFLFVLLLFPFGFVAGCSEASRSSSGDAASSQEAAPQLYQCPMHPDVTSHEPGDCPICGMRLVPVEQGGEPHEHAAEQGNADCEVAYWVAPMDPNYRSDKPGKSPMGMDLVPVCKSDLAVGGDVDNRVTVKIPPQRVQQLGIRLSPVAFTEAAIRTLRTPGTVTVDEEKVRHVHTRVAGWIERVHVQAVGDAVRKGQVLYELYSPDLVATQEELLAAVNAGNSGAAEAARRRLRYWNVSDIDIRRIEQRGKASRRITFRSPIDGYVHALKAIDGMYVEARTQLYTLVDLSTVWVRGHFYETELPLLSMGQQARIQLPTTGDPRIGAIRWLYPQVDARTRFVDARFEFDNPDLRLRPGMYVDVQLEIDLGPALVVPKDAVMRTGRQNIAFVHIGNGRFEPRALELGPETDDGYVVYDGLDEGEQVADQATFFIDSESALKAALAKFRSGGAGGHSGH
ncbi:MAG: efflux RND transporter periplasmic adaptor subunit [Candidatus Dadabacteria bacterium]|nr:MAG: efflux RND transporter periplasmic adaptor subunit [Candidatus Dadabacteria bacterium]